MPNAEKQRIVSELRDIVAQSKGAILTDYRGLTVAEVTSLRRKLRDVDAEYHIVKNTLFKIAVGDSLTPDMENLLAGPTAIAFVHEDIVAPTKALLDFLRDLRKPEIKVKGGWVEGRIYSPDQMTALSKLPPREQIVAQLVGTLNGPVSQLVGTLDNIIGEFVRTLQAVADKRKEGGESVAATAEAPAPVAAAPTTEEAAAPPAPEEAAAPAEETAEAPAAEPVAAAEAPAQPVAEEAPAAPEAESAPGEEAAAATPSEEAPAEDAVTPPVEVAPETPVPPSEPAAEEE
ncbi:MAG TPA: 50S ribosomal protein L10 [Chthonomonadaceae bacterium]|nr:50S ribosomal protein L10 [Chthonomonadaceae bacterium]